MSSIATSIDILDRAFKTQKIVTGGLRRQRMPERQRQKDILDEQRLERKRRMTKYTEAYASQLDMSTFSPSHDDDSVNDSPSDASVRTPEEYSLTDIDVAIRKQSLDDGASSSGRESMDTSGIKHGFEDVHFKPILNQFSASATLADYADDDEDYLSSESDSDFIPIEVATPVYLYVPKYKPLVVSIPSRSAPESATLKPLPAKVDDDSRAEPAWVKLARNAFLACEATPMEVPNPTDEHSQARKEVLRRDKQPRQQRRQHQYSKHIYTTPVVIDSSRRLSRRNSTEIPIALPAASKSVPASASKQKPSPMDELPHRPKPGRTESEASLTTFLNSVNPTVEVSAAEKEAPEKTVAQKESSTRRSRGESIGQTFTFKAGRSKTNRLSISAPIQPEPPKLPEWETLQFVTTPQKPETTPNYPKLRKSARKSSLKSESSG